ncbi:hypothetical protein IGI04_012619 [Brassica rapa subsp. trilocularis]|uniref:Uncharacterized protein n=1 Tax=Brassica rapa subsp. trilocularis TaxID=1813537 RepID=A0ABQ7N6G4_BRACM|nr:hypothetical protein IGI04_012619 [Brassica rapa subsp. trilocularis]
MAILSAICQLWFFQPFSSITVFFQAVILHSILVVGQFSPVPATKCVISVVGLCLHYDETVKVVIFRLHWSIYMDFGKQPVMDAVNMAMEVQQDPVVAADGNVIQNNSPQMDNVVLEENFWHNAPIDEVHEEFERRMGVVRTERKRKFVDNLMREMEVTSPDEDEDHATLEWEERRWRWIKAFANWCGYC